jgi:uncharacterized protein with PIN domain
MERFAPPLAPWTICTACNGRLSAVSKAAVEPVLQPGTRRTYDSFARCPVCGQVYWRGAHSRRLEGIVAAAAAAVARPRSGRPLTGGAAGRALLHGAVDQAWRPERR